MGLTREQQKEFAYAILDISERDKSLETLTSLNKLVDLLFDSVEGDNFDIPIDLSEYIYTLKSIAAGEEDDGWREYLKNSLDENLTDD